MQAGFLRQKKEPDFKSNFQIKKIWIISKLIQSN